MKLARLSEGMLTVGLDQYAAAWNVSGERERLCFDLVMFAGMRESEVFALWCGNIGEEGIEIERSWYKGRYEPPRTEWIIFAILRRSHSTLHRQRNSDLKFIADQQGHGATSRIAEGRAGTVAALEIPDSVRAAVEGMDAEICNAVYSVPKPSEAGRVQ
jgi:hypothetical protein